MFTPTVAICAMSPSVTHDAQCRLSCLFPCKIYRRAQGQPSVRCRARVEQLLEVKKSLITVRHPKKRAPVTGRTADGTHTKTYQVEVTVRASIRHVFFFSKLPVRHTPKTSSLDIFACTPVRKVDETPQSGLFHVAVCCNRKLHMFHRSSDRSSTPITIHDLHL